ncbi:MAG: GNAT family N-acetyltransferase [Melioribacteraceae bacterium]|nr:GNAT family N-acetyltransferase [Melioribacteraceae bacterium]
MIVNLSGKKIRITNTIESDIPKIIEFETSNNQFVNSYNKEKHLALLSDSDCIHLSLRRLDNDIIVGHMLIFGVENENSALELRRIAINEKGFGYGREALQLLKILCFKELKFHRLWLDVYDDNSMAIHLYESEGFIKEGVLREKFKTENGYRSQRVYSILENEYEKNP